MDTLRRRVVVVLAVAVCAFAIAALAAQPRFITIEVPGAPQTTAFGINPAGDIAGSYVDTSGFEHGMILRNGAVETIDYPGALWTRIDGINPRGDIVGQYGIADGSAQGFVRWSGSLDFIPIEIAQPYDHANTMPWKIGVDGTIVGCYHQGTASNAIGSTMHGWVLSRGVLTTEPTNGSMHTGINPAGAIVGHVVIPPPARSYIITAAGKEYFVYPGAAATRAHDIAPNGDVVGYYRDSNNHFHGFLRHHGEMSSIDVPDATFTSALGINAEGDIVGYFIDGAGLIHGFLRTGRGSD